LPIPARSFSSIGIVDLILPDGRAVGTIMASGWGGAAKAPGAPSAILQANMTITGGTGAYLGNPRPGRPRWKHHRPAQRVNA